jgi:hypothetical protein
LHRYGRDDHEGLLREIWPAYSGLPEVDSAAKAQAQNATMVLYGTSVSWRLEDAKNVMKQYEGSGKSRIHVALPPERV